MIDPMRKARVLFLAEELRVGGAETYFYRLEQGINREVVDFKTMAVPSNAVEKLTHPEQFSAYTFSPADRVHEIARQLKAQDVDVVHANSLQLLVCAFFALRRARSSAKLVYTRHNKTALESVSEGLYFMAVKRMADIVVSICETEKSRLIEGGVDGAKVWLINNAVNADRFPFKQRFDTGASLKPRIGILARISPEKRHDLFLSIASAYHEMRPQAEFIIAGDGPDFDKIAHAIDEQNLGDFIRMKGRVVASDFLPTVDVLLLVSDREVMPMSILEGMASGCGIVARDVGGIKDVVRPDTGVLIEGSDPHVYAKAIDGAVNACEFYSKTQKARALIEKSYSLNHALREHERLYNSLCK